MPTLIVPSMAIFSAFIFYMITPTPIEARFFMLVTLVGLFLTVLERGSPKGETSDRLSNIIIGLAGYVVSWFGTILALGILFGYH
jgi:hypothetical protein